MKFIGNWKAWESKDGSVKRIYVADGKYLEEGELGMPSQVGLNADEIAFAYKLVQGKTFIELYEMVKTSNSSKKTNKKNGDYADTKKHIDFLVEQCEYFDKYMNDDSLIIFHDAFGAVDVVPKFAEGVTEDSAEYQVGAIE